MAADLLYDFFRSSTGLCLAAIGLGFLAQPLRQPARKALGILYLSAGTAFLFSWFSGYLTLPAPLDLLLLLAITYALGVSVLDLIVYLFGGEAQRGTRRRLVRTGLAWSLLLWLLPFLDRLFGLESTRLSPEDQQLLTPFRAVAYFAVYLWPIAMAVVAIRIAHYRLTDLPKESRSVRLLIINLAVAVVLLLGIGGGLLFHSGPLYRWGHVALQVWFLAGYLFIQARPDTFQQARKDIEVSHKHRLALTGDEAGAIAHRLEKLLLRAETLADSGFKLSDLAKASGIPAYRLSVFFNAHRGLSFSAWLNEARIKQACSLLREKKTMSILDIAFEVGYSSKGTFNSQFQRLTGTTPSAYRKSL